MDQVGLAHLGSLKILIKRLNKAPSRHLLLVGLHYCSMCLAVELYKRNFILLFSKT